MTPLEKLMNNAYDKALERASETTRLFHHILIRGEKTENGCKEVFMLDIKNKGYNPSFKNLTFYQENEEQLSPKALEQIFYSMGKVSKIVMNEETDGLVSTPMQMIPIGNRLLLRLYHPERKFGIESRYRIHDCRLSLCEDAQAALAERIPDECYQQLLISYGKGKPAQIQFTDKLNRTIVMMTPQNGNTRNTISITPKNNRTYSDFSRIENIIKAFPLFTGTDDMEFTLRLQPRKTLKKIWKDSKEPYHFSEIPFNPGY